MSDYDLALGAAVTAAVIAFAFWLSGQMDKARKFREECGEPKEWHR